MWYGVGMRYGPHHQWVPRLTGAQGAHQEATCTRCGGKARNVTHRAIVTLADTAVRLSKNTITYLWEFKRAGATTWELGWDLPPCSAKPNARMLRTEEIAQVRAEYEQHHLAAEASRIESLRPEQPRRTPRESAQTPQSPAGRAPVGRT